MKWLKYLSILISAQLVYSENMGEIYSQLYSGNINSAILRLEEMSNNDTTNQEINSALAHAYTLASEDQKAIEVYEKLQSLDTGNVEPLFNLSKLLMKQGQLSRSSELVKDGLKSQPYHKGLIDLAARISYDENDYQDAFSYYSKLIDMNINVGRYYHLRARCGAKMDSIDLAISDFARALKINPANQQIIYEYAHCLYSASRNPEAFNLIQREMENFGGTTKYERLKGNIYHKMGDYSKALNSYTIALSRGRANAYLLKLIGICHYELGSFEKSEAFLSQALLFDGGDPMAFYYLGKCAMEMGDHSRAASCFTIAIKINQPSYINELYINMAQCYEKEGNPILAIRTCRDGLEISPDNHHLLYLLANLYDGYYLDKSVALAHFEKVVESPIDDEVDKYVKYRIKTIKENLHLGDK